MSSPWKSIWSSARHTHREALHKNSCPPSPAPPPWVLLGTVGAEGLGERTSAEKYSMPLG